MNERGGFGSIDPLKETYHEGIIDSPEHQQAVEYHSAALLCIDLQYLDAARGHGVFANAAISGVPLEAQEYYFQCLENQVLKNVRELQDLFREHDLEVIHTRIQSLTTDGRDRSAGHKRLDLHAPPGSREADFLEEVAPIGDEIVINKTASGVFTSTNLYYVLKNLKIDALFVVGVYTNECVSTTIRDGSDLGFLMTMISDGCATVTEELQHFTIATLRDRYARVLTTDEIRREVEAYAERRRNEQAQAQA